MGSAPLIDVRRSRKAHPLAAAADFDGCVLFIALSNDARGETSLSAAARRD
jgi:hypothetical protein